MVELTLSDSTHQINHINNYYYIFLLFLNKQIVQYIITYKQ